MPSPPADGSIIVTTTVYPQPADGPRVVTTTLPVPADTTFFVPAAQPTITQIVPPEQTTTPILPTSVASASSSRPQAPPDPNSSPTNTPTSGAAAGLSTAEKAGIGVGVSVFAVAVLALLGFIAWKVHNRTRGTTGAADDVSASGPPGEVALSPHTWKPELEGSAVPNDSQYGGDYHRKVGRPQGAAELGPAQDQPRQIYELPHPS